MFNTAFWFHNDLLDTAIEVYGPPGIPPEPPVIDYGLIDPCSKGVYTGDIVLLGCGEFDGRLGIGSLFPQQKIDVAGSIKIDENIYDSVNTPARNGYFLARDKKGIRWIPLIAEHLPNANAILGIPTDGVFVLDEGIPLPPP